MDKEMIFELITRIIAWITSLGTAGTFIAFAILGKLTKTIIKLLLLATFIAIIFWIISNPSIRETIGGMF